MTVEEIKQHLRDGKRILGIEVKFLTEEIESLQAQLAEALREKAEREKGCDRCNNPCNNCARLGDILGCQKCKSGRQKFKMYEKRMLSDLFCRSCGRRLEEKKDG